jgi:hypothetical protein
MSQHIYTKLYSVNVSKEEDKLTELVQIGLRIGQTWKAGEEARQLVRTGMEQYFTTTCSEIPKIYYLRHWQETFKIIC